MLAEYACLPNEAPAARRYPQLTYFFAGADPVQLASGAPVQRGLVLYGGLASPYDEDTSPILDDLWLFDITGWSSGEPCPWHQLSPSASASGSGRFGGTLTYDAAGPGVVLSGGASDALEGRLTRTGVMYAFLDELEAGFEPVALAPRPAFSFLEFGDDACKNREVPCHRVENNVCQPYVLHTSILDICSGTLDPGCLAPGFSSNDFRGCFADPGCIDPGATGILDPVRAEFGVFHAADLFDPVAEELRLYGGAQGCDGACPQMDPLFLASGRSLPIGISGMLEAINAPGATRASLVDFTFDFEAPISVLTRPHGWPEALEGPGPDGIRATIRPSWGLKRAAGATLGLRWSMLERQWRYAPGGPTFLLVGGTAHQELEPDRFRVVERQVVQPGELCSPPDGALTPTSWFERGWLPLPWSFDQARIDFGVLRYHPNSHHSVVTSTIPPGYDRAAVAVEPDAMLVVGGRDTEAQAGSRRLRVIEPGGGWSPVTLGSAFPARYGARAAFDPISRTAYVFGGAAQDTELYQVKPFNTVLPGRDSTFDMQEVELELELQPPSGAWVVRAAFAVEHSCEVPIDRRVSGTLVDALDASDCFADQIALTFPTTDGGSLGNARVHVTGPSGVRRRLTGLPNPGSDAKTTTVVYPLPELVVDGDVLEMEVAVAFAPGTPERTLPAALERAGAQRAAMAGIPPAEVFRELPVWVNRSVWDVRERPKALVDLSAVRVLPGGRTALGVGARDEGCATTAFERLVPRAVSPTGEVCLRPGAPVPREQFTVFLTPWTSAVERISLPGPVDVWVHFDSRLEPLLFNPSTRTGELPDYARGPALASSSLAADLQWLVDRLGPVPRPNLHLAYLPPEDGQTEVGISKAGLHFVQAFKDTGEKLAPEVFEHVTTHELAHAWIGHTWTLDDDALWLKEGLPTLLGAMRYPNSLSNENRLAAGLDSLIAQSLLQDGLDELENPDHAEQYVVGYEIAPYTLAQLHAAARSIPHTDAEIWAAWRAMLGDLASEAQSPGLGDLCVQEAGTQPWVCAAAVHAFIRDDLSLDQFYEEGIRLGRVGSPILGLTRLQLGGSAEAVVSQVQTWMLGWPTFTWAPFHLGCAPHDDDSTVAFSECTVAKGGGGVLGPPYRVAQGEAQPLALHPVSPLPAGVHATPAWVALLANDALMPEYIGQQYSERPRDPARAATWWLKCAAGDETRVPDCAADGDSDGYPLLGDCNDTDSGIHPDVLVDTVSGGADEGATDLNCDGWPTPAFLTTP